MNENNPPMVLPNGYVYGENVSEYLILTVKKDAVRYDRI